METYKGKGQGFVTVKAVTWYKDSHSLFDYESTKTTVANYAIPLNTKSVTFYRNRQTQQVSAQLNDQMKLDHKSYQILTRFQINPTMEHNTNKARLNFISKRKPTKKQPHSDRVNTNQSAQNQSSREQETYLIVRKIKDINEEPKGYKLHPGQTIKIGRVEFFVSEVATNGTLHTAPTKCNISRKVMHFDPKIDYKPEANQCKICLEQTQQGKNYLFNPCKCSGSCGTVHINCLMEWIHFKVKKQVVGGTLHYNFQKFDCQVCKTQLPMTIDIKGKNIEMLPLQKPQGNYIILEGACQKSKSVMIIKNVPPQGIKLGRGHECEIRITDISVSRNHALIKNVNGNFYVFDNKSKFGTLVRQDNMSLDIGRQPHGVQIGKTVLTMEIKDKNK